jgi:hypothetical protein
MKLKSFGCSFIFGSELSDNYQACSYSQLTWPALLAKYHDYQYDCFARPGCGNLQILDQVLNQSASSDSAVFVIGWTWIGRFDYVDKNTQPEQWQTFIPAEHTPGNEFYYKFLHSQTRDKLSSLIYIKLAIDTLKQKNIPFIMTYMDDLIFDQQWHVTDGITELQNYIKPHLKSFDGLTFLEWSRKNGYHITEKWHPLEEAHQTGFELINNQSFL